MSREANGNSYAIEEVKHLLPPDEFAIIERVRRIKAHGFGRLQATVADGQVTFLDTTVRERNPGAPNPPGKIA